jgi:hypothetical protein
MINSCYTKDVMTKFHNRLLTQRLMIRYRAGHNHTYTA